MNIQEFIVILPGIAEYWKRQSDGTYMPIMSHKGKGDWVVISR